MPRLSPITDNRAFWVLPVPWALVVGLAVGIPRSATAQPVTITAEEVEALLVEAEAGDDLLLVELLLTEPTEAPADARMPASAPSPVAAISGLEVSNLLKDSLYRFLEVSVAVGHHDNATRSAFSPRSSATLAGSITGILSSDPLADWSADLIGTYQRTRFLQLEDVSDEQLSYALARVRRRWDGAQSVALEAVVSTVSAENDVSFSEIQRSTSELRLIDLSGRLQWQYQPSRAEAGVWELGPFFGRTEILDSRDDLTTLGAQISWRNRQLRGTLSTAVDDYDDRPSRNPEGLATLQDTALVWKTAASMRWKAPLDDAERWWLELSPGLRWHEDLRASFESYAKADLKAGLEYRLTSWSLEAKLSGAAQHYRERRATETTEDNLYRHQWAWGVAVQYRPRPQLSLRLSYGQERQRANDPAEVLTERVALLSATYELF